MTMKDKVSHVMNQEVEIYLEGLCGVRWHLGQNNPHIDSMYNLYRIDGFENITLCDKCIQHELFGLYLLQCVNV